MHLPFIRGSAALLTARPGLILSLAIGFAASTSSSQAVLIASDNFQTTTAATTGYYTAGNINFGAATVGTYGYYYGAGGGNPAPGFASGTGAFLAQVGGLSNPLAVKPAEANPSLTNEGSLVAAGNANDRYQYRDFATLSPIISNEYHFSILLSQSVVSYTGLTYAGIGPSRPLGQNDPGTNPITRGFYVGFQNGALTLSYNGVGSDTDALATQTLLATPTASVAYLVALQLSISGTTGTLTPTVYDGAGVAVSTANVTPVTMNVTSLSDFGSFTARVSGGFNNSSPSKVTYDEFRFGTTQADVMAVPEPGSALLLAGGAVGLLARRRRRA